MNNNLISKIESILFVASKPLSDKVIAKAIGKSKEEVREVMEGLINKYNIDDSGINILQDGNDYQMATNPDNIDVIESFIKNEVSGELTKAQLETLTVIAYREPITRPELEQIRGVNCSLILRNLLVRGLIEEKESEDKITDIYTVSFEALSHLGIRNVNELPDYSTLNKHEHIENILATDSLGD